MVNFKIGVIIPTRGDRPELLANCYRMLNSQSLEPEIIITVDEDFNSKEIDVTKRYRLGYEQLRNKGLDFIAFIEDDDYYRPTYLEFMASKWIEFNKPDLLGHNFTIYYHIKLRKYFYFYHEQRSSAMNTIIKADLNFDWCKDNDPYTDIHLWNFSTLGITTRVIIQMEPDSPICLGIKHNTDCFHGTDFHKTHLHKFTIDDNGFLEANTDPESFKFYIDYAAKLPDAVFSPYDLRVIANQ